MEQRNYNWTNMLPCIYEFESATRGIAVYKEDMMYIFWIIHHAIYAILLFYLLHIILLHIPYVP